MRSTHEKLGSTTNLLCGYNSTWLSKDMGNNALFTVPAVSMEAQNTRLITSTGKWSFPFISLHENGESIMDTLLPYKVSNPSDGSREATLPAGTLMLNNNDRETALKILSKTLGVNLNKENTGFALVQLKRIDGKEEHASVQSGIPVHPNPVRIPKELGLTDNFRRAVAKLKRLKIRGAAFSPNDVTKKDAAAYLNLFAEQGTHFISSLTFGDVIFQVYAMEKTRFERVKKYYEANPDELEEINAVLFRQFTTEWKANNYGYVTEYGNVMSFSQSKKLAETLKQGKWQETTYAKKDSIFSVFEKDGPLNLKILNTDFVDSTEVVKELTSLTLLIEYSRKQIWRRVFAAAAVQIYKSAIQPHFAQYCKYGADILLQDKELPGFLTNIATPNINTYKPGLDLSGLTFVAEKQVKTFTLYSNLISNQTVSKISLPGEDILICGQVYALETDTYTTTIQLSDQALKSFAFYAKQFYGGVQFHNATNTEHFTIVDGLRYQNTIGANGRLYVKIDQDYRKIPEATKLDRLKQNLQFNYSFAAAKLAAIARDKPIREFLRESLLWIGAIIPENSKDIEMLELRVRALDFANVDNDQTLGSFVPILPFKDYQNQVDSILKYIAEIDKTIQSYHQEIENRKTQELVIDVANDLNKNIIESGKLLAGYVDASIQQQRALSSYYDTIIEQKGEEKKSQQMTINDLEKQLFEQQGKVDSAVRDFKQALEGLQVKEAVKFGILVAKDLFTLGSSISAPIDAAEDVTELALLVKRIQKLLQVLKAAYVVYDDVTGNIGNLTAMLKSFDDVSEVLSSNLEWDELGDKLKEVLASAPSDRDVDEKKAALLAAFSILVLKGKAHTTAQANYHQTAREIYDQQKQKNLIDAHVKTMKELNTNLRPENIDKLVKTKIDLVGLTGSLSMIRSQMLGILSKAFTLQDQSLQYTYLQQPTAIESFDTLGINRALVTQNTNTIRAKEEWSKYQAATTTPIEIEVEVPVADLRNGGIYQFNILPGMPTFYPYIDTRVMAVIAKIDGIQSTNSGEYLVDLTYMGRPFYDRNYNRDRMTFNTLSRGRTYEYKVKGNRPMFSDKGESWSEGVNPITPFSTWHISIPATKTNEGIKFNGLTAKITLTFVLKTRIHDASVELMDMLGGKKWMAVRTRPSIDMLLKEMAGKSILNDWDVVFSMSLDKINEVLKTQYEELKNSISFESRIIAETEIEGGDIGDINTYLLKKFDIKYGYPKLNFLANSDKSGKLEMEIPSGSVRKGTKYISKDLDDRPLLESIAKKAGLLPSAVKEVVKNGKKQLELEVYGNPIAIKNKAKLNATMNIQMVKGLVNGDKNILSVVLDMSKGSFEPEDINIDMDDEEMLAFTDAVKSYFKMNPVQFIINSLDLTGISTLADLKPNQFLIKAFKTQSGGEMLRLFIKTNNRTVNGYDQPDLAKLPDSIPEGSECSLIINSKIFFNSVLPQSITQGWKIQGVDPKDSNKAWSTKFTQASAQGNVDLSSLDHESMGGSVHLPSTIKYRYKPSQNPTIWLLSNMTIVPSRDGQMVMKYDEKNTFNYLESVTVCQGACGNPVTKPLSTDVKLSIDAKLPVKITGKGRDQKVEINIENEAVKLDATTSGGGPCGADNLQSQVNKKLKDVVPGEITKNINIKFNSVSVFALQNLLFPSKNYIDLKEVHVPGDLLIVGKFITVK